jgi:hypothetical protein
MALFEAPNARRAGGADQPLWILGMPRAALTLSLARDALLRL